MRTLFVISIALILLGAAVLGYDHYSYTTRETVLQVGPIIATAERLHTVSMPPLIGWLLVGGGTCLFIMALLGRRP